MSPQHFEPSQSTFYITSVDSLNIVIFIRSVNLFSFITSSSFQGAISVSSEKCWFLPSSAIRAHAEVTYNLCTESHWSSTSEACRSQIEHSPRHLMLTALEFAFHTHILFVSSLAFRWASHNTRKLVPNQSDHSYNLVRPQNKYSRETGIKMI